LKNLQYIENKKMPNNRFHNKENNTRARSLRREMTEQERKLWFRYLRDFQKKFKRQVTLGYYIADFYCAEKKIAVELDGSQHYFPEGEDYDERRDEYIKKMGITILRYSNNDIDNNFEVVCRDIFDRVMR